MNGILFKPEMIQAIIEGRKTQTRRIIKFHKPFESPDSWEVIYPDGGGNWIAWDKDRPGLAEFTKKAYPNGEGFKSKYHIGQKLYIKEAWATMLIFDQLSPKQLKKGSPIWFADTDQDAPTGCGWDKGKPRSPMFLMEWMARYFIEITEVEPQRLQEITFEDAFAEGMEHSIIMHNPVEDLYYPLWDSINPKYPVISNPWIWRYSFKQVK